MIADAVAAGLIERNAKKNGKAEAAEEPMAAWERELLGSTRLHRLKRQLNGLSPLSFMLCGPPAGTTFGRRPP